MSFSDQSTDTLIKLWNNLKKGLDEVHTTIENGTFNTPPDTKGACPPSQSGQLTMWLAMAVDTELTKRKVKH